MIAYALLGVEDTRNDADYDYSAWTEAIMNGADSTARRRRKRAATGLSATRRDTRAHDSRASTSQWESVTE